MANQTLQDIFNNPEYDELLKMNNMESYKGYDIYETDEHTLASTSTNDGGVYTLSVRGKGQRYRQAMRYKIDQLTK